MTESTQSKTRNVKIKSMGGRYATGGFFVAAGAKICPGDVCEVPASVAKTLEGFDSVEFTNAKANCVLVVNGERGEIDRG